MGNWLLAVCCVWGCGREATRRLRSGRGWFTSWLWYCDEHGPTPWGRASPDHAGKEGT